MASSEDSYIGLRVARWRDIAGLTQQQLGDAVGISHNHVSLIENGHKAITSRRVLIGFAKALGVSVGDLIAAPFDPQSPQDMLTYSIAASVRLALDGGTDVAQPESAQALLDSATRVIQARMACDTATLATLLPTTIGQARAAANDGADEQIRMAGLDALVKACIYGSYVLKTSGNTDLSMRLAERAALAAEKLGNPVHRAAAQMALAQSLMANGIRERTLELARSGADSIQGQLTDIDALAWYGTLHLQAALASASLDHADDANAHLAEADDAATRLNGEHSWGMEFTTTNVTIWRIGVALENGEPERAPEIARQVDQSKIRTPQRLARLHMDTGRGLYAAGKNEEAVKAFLLADAAAPSEVRHRSSVREIVGQLVRDARRLTGSPQLRDLAVKCGVDPLAA